MITLKNGLWKKLFKVLKMIIENYYKFILLLFIQNRRKKNYIFFRKWYLKNPFYIESNDETIKKFILPMNKYKNCSYRQYLNYFIFEKLYNKVREIEEQIERD